MFGLFIGTIKADKDPETVLDAATLCNVFLQPAKEGQTSGNVAILKVIGRQANLDKFSEEIGSIMVTRPLNDMDFRTP